MAYLIICRGSGRMCKRGMENGFKRKEKGLPFRYQTAAEVPQMSVGIEERRKKKERKELEEKILELELKIQDLHEYMCLEEVFTNHEKMWEANRELKEAESKLEEYYDLWAEE